MTDKFDERFSALVDGELSDQDTLLSQVAQDETLRARWTRYHVMRDAIHNHLSDIAPTDTPIDISAHVREAIDKEPVILAPWHQRIHVKPMLKQVSGLAVAATIATLAILVVQNTAIKEPSTATNIASTSAETSLKPTFKTVSLAAVKKTQKSRRLDRAVEIKLSNYLVNHNEYSVTSKMRGILPYTRIVSFTPSERVVDEN